jgi:hypothetical protein
MKRSHQKSTRLSRYDKVLNNDSTLNYDETDQSIRITSPKNKLAMSKRLNKNKPAIDDLSDIDHQSKSNYSKSGGSNNLLNYAKKLQTEGIDRHPSL